MSELPDGSVEIHLDDATEPASQACLPELDIMFADANRSWLAASRSQAVRLEPARDQVPSVRNRESDRRKLQHELAGRFNRMQEHLLGDGRDALGDYEMLELILSVALSRQDTRTLARKLMVKFRSFGGTVNASAADLMAMRGIGRKGAVAIKLIQAAAMRTLRNEVIEKPLIQCWQQLVGYISARLMHERVEHFHILFLDTKGALIVDEDHGRGTINHVPVYPREVVRRCLELDASAVIMVHNHPSGDPKPSTADVIMTRNVERALATMGISLHDHVVVSRQGCQSFRDLKLLD